MGFLKTAVLVVVTAVAVKVYPVFWTTDLPLNFGGKILDPKFKNVENVFRKNFENKWDEKEGAAFAVYHKGKLVVDLWGGYADKASKRLWKEDTNTIIFSSSKAVSALVAGMLIDRGLMDTETLVTKFWPEFGKHGKDNVTVGMLLSHQAGLAYLDSPISKEDCFDFKAMGKKFEDQVPNWPPGTASGYHALTYGWLVDQLVRRVDPKKRSIGQFFREEIREAFGADFYLGLPRDQMYRVARMSPPTTFDSVRMASSIRGLFMLYGLHTAVKGLEKVASNPNWMFSNGVNAFNDPEIWTMEIGAANGIATAKGLAKTFSLLLEGKLIQKRQVLQKLSQPVQINSQDAILNLPVTRGYGFWFSKNPQGDYIFGHPGYGGQNVKVDLRNGLSFAYVTNGLQPGMGDLTQTFMRLQVATYEALGIKE